MKNKLFKNGGFENYRGKVRIDNVIFNSVVRVGVARFGDVFYDINLEVAEYLPHATNGSASDMNMATSNGSIHQNDPFVNSSAKKDAEWMLIKPLQFTQEFNCFQIFNLR